ncbi:hypothetical protein LAZ40_05655 [Cereibacter sphaeroides]|uniref:hypothetical protein n=1 Tax=Cereibacter sphaeroides TaxID=1063 RepID=UPI001F434D4B|nr:hypothetical protein [Cereibacter sphaeroides]MCE6958535.1 hypothetical protein [Cereibacter sphaeroides]MCE6972802.1 hypothetical protein [Cereibacter sphaeroides]
MDLATRTARKLASQHVICRNSDGAAFNLLGTPDGVEAVEAKLGEFDLRLCMTSLQTGYFAAEASPEEAARHLRASSEALAREARRIEDVADFLLDVFTDGERIQSDQIIEVSRVLDIVNGSNALVEKLEVLTAGLNMTSNTTQKRVSRLFAKLQQDGFLVTLDAQKETYVVSARVDRAWDIIEHFASSIPSVATAVAAASEGDGRQGDLFA